MDTSDKVYIVILISVVLLGIVAVVYTEGGDAGKEELKGQHREYFMNVEKQRLQDSIDIIEKEYPIKQDTTK